MLEFLTKWFGGGANRASKPKSGRPGDRLRTHLKVEELDPRVLMSSSPMGHAAGHFGGQALVAGPASMHSQGMELVASLSNASGATGKAEFNVSKGELEISIKGAAANTTLTVAIDGNTVTTLTTDAAGKGRLEITQPSLAVLSGSTITVGDLQGTFANSTEGAEEQNAVELKARLTGTTGAKGQAEFKATSGQLELEIKGAAAATTYNVTVDNVVVGQVTTDASGKAEVKFSGLQVQVGSTISIADTLGNPPILQGVFTQDS